MPVAVGTAPDIDRAIGQRLRYVATVAKLGWLVKNGPAAAPARWLPELVLRALTGAEATGWSLAARTLPVEYAVEWSRLIELNMEGSVG